MIQFDSEQTRRLPVYLLLDVSGSMAGVGVEAVNQGVEMLLKELKNDPMALETAWISCITFRDDSKEILPLTEVGKATIPHLDAGGATNLGSALNLLLTKLRTEIRPNTPEKKGDWKPLVFIFGDGQPTDQAWPAAAAELREFASRKTANVVALASGTNIDVNVLKQITPNTLLMVDMTADNIRSFVLPNSKWDKLANN